MQIRKRLVGKCSLHQMLAVLHRTGHFKRMYILAQSCELGCLCLGQRPVGVQHAYADAVEPEKTVGCSRARIAHCRHKDIAPRCCVTTVDILHKPGHEACAIVLERKCRTMEKLENVSVAYFYKWSIEGKRFVDDILQHRSRNLAAEKCRGNNICYVLQLHFPDIVEQSPGNRRNRLRHI